MCNCIKYGDCEEATPTRNEFIREFTQLDSCVQLWTELFICNNCGQHWVVEENAEMDRRSNMAYKVDTPKNWTKHDTRPALSQWLILQHGGLTDQQCVHAGCNEYALKDMVVCVFHGHSEYNWN